jgi:hypothetical protein
MISSRGSPIVRQTFSRFGTYFVTDSEKSSERPIIVPEYRYVAPRPDGCSERISSFSREPIVAIEERSVMCQPTLRMSST